MAMVTSYAVMLLGLACHLEFLIRNLVFPLFYLFIFGSLCLQASMWEWHCRCWLATTVVALRLVAVNDLLSHAVCLKVYYCLARNRQGSTGSCAFRFMLASFLA